MGRPLTDDQLSFLAHINSPAYLEEQRKAEAARQEAEAARIAESNRRWELDRARWREEQAKEEAQIKLLAAALKAAGIHMSVSGYYEDCQVWAKLPDGTLVEFDNNFSTDDYE
jgi:hypothetical protein